MTDNTQLPPDVIGHMAALGGTDEAIGTCNSCLRAVIYGALAHISQAGADLLTGDRLGAAGHISYATKVLLELAKLDFSVTAPGSDDMSDEDWKLAMLSFYEARVGHFVNAATGEIIFEPHDDNGHPEASLL